MAPDQPAAPTDPAVLRAEIERTRTELGDTMAALAAKLDVKAQANAAASRTARRLRAQRPIAAAGLAGAVLGLIAFIAIELRRRTTR